VLDAALYVGRTSADDFERKLAYITVQRQLAQDVPYLWLSHIPWGLGAQNTVRGIDSATLPDKRARRGAGRWRGAGHPDLARRLSRPNLRHRRTRRHDLS